MGYDLYGLEDEERYFRFNIFNWGKALRMAEQFGWQPQGTSQDSNEDWAKNWDGTYGSNDGQIVSIEDAKNLADAVEKGLTELDKAIGYRDNSASDLEYHKQHLAKFVDFCRAGAFRIY